MQSKTANQSNPNTFKYGLFSEKALDYLYNSNAPINIAHGAVRSSKTITSTIAWLQFIAQSPHTEFMQSGKTRRSLYRNVLRDEIKMLEGMGIPYKHKENDGILEIDGKTVWLVGFSDRTTEEVIKGMTIGGWYADETNTYLKATVEEALDRCSLEGSQVYWTMNPDSPYHYIYRDYITNEQLLNAGDVKTWAFTLDDNPNLPESYKDQIKRRYPQGSVQYKRKVKGLWVIAEGIIYDRFVEANHTFKTQPYENYDYYVISTDYGSGNVTVFGYFGIKRSDQGNHYHLLKEFYWDAVEKDLQLTDKELIDNAIKLLDRRHHIESFFTPHDAASLRAELLQRNYLGKPMPMTTYTPNVLDDIHNIQTIISENRFMIQEDCTNTIGQMLTYAWDPKAQQRGEDKPLKVNDHAPDMIRGAVLGSRGNAFTQSDKSYDYSVRSKRLESERKGNRNRRGVRL